MTSVAACEPLLPPLEMISGTNSTSTIASRDPAPRTPPCALSVSSCPRNSSDQPAHALAQHLERSRSACTAVPAPRCRRSSGCPRWPLPRRRRARRRPSRCRAARRGSRHREGDPVVLLEHLDRLSWSSVARSAMKLPSSRSRDACASGSASSSCADAQVVDQLPAVVDDVDHVERLAVLAVARGCDRAPAARSSRSRTATKSGVISRPMLSSG